MSVLDFGDVVYMHASAQCVNSLDTVYHGALHFITNFKALTHRCTLYAQVGWSALTTRRLNHWHILIYKAIIGFLPSYLQAYTVLKSQGKYELRSQDLVLLSTTRARIGLGERAFRYAAPATWNKLQEQLNLKELVSLPVFKETLCKMDISTASCKCFD